MLLFNYYRTKLNEIGSITLAPTDFFQRVKRESVQGALIPPLVSTSKYKSFIYRGSYPKFINCFLGSHCLIAGTTGSGKSNFLNIIVKGLIVKNYKLVLIDPKRVELYAYRKKAMMYAQDVPGVVEALNYAVSVIEKRYQAMQRKGLKTSDQKPLYIVVDELSDLMITDKKAVLPLLVKIAQIGRAAKVFLLLATQSPSRQVLTAPLLLNMGVTVALRCSSPIESKQVLGVTGAELLPRFGEALVKSPEGIKKIKIPKDKN